MDIGSLVGQMFICSIILYILYLIIKSICKHLKISAKYMTSLIVIVAILSGGYNIYQYIRMRNIKKYLDDSVKYNIGCFLSKSGNIDDEYSFIEQYNSICAAQSSYGSFTEGRGIPAEKWDSSLPYLLSEIRGLMLNNKEKYLQIFQRDEAIQLMHKISMDYEDEESIGKVLELIK